MTKLSKWLDSHLLQLPVIFVTNTLVILITIGLLCPLVIFNASVVFVLLVNSYLNVFGCGVSFIVLKQAKAQEAVQEARAQEDHERLKVMFENQKFELAELKELLGRPGLQCQLSQCLQYQPSQPVASSVALALVVPGQQSPSDKT